jgi:NAD(P)-dependent dehydrogenase (short-subunit alcohol dehydrogenase family)
MSASDAALAVVTGAGNGIGRASAQALTKRGLRVCCVGRRRAPLAETAELLGEAGTPGPPRPRCSTRPCRVGQPGEVAAAITYLACDATYTSGAALACDGGYGAS